MVHLLGEPKKQGPAPVPALGATAARPLTPGARQEIEKAKARWTNSDYDEMERMPMIFERSDEDSIRRRMHVVDLPALSIRRK
jgi:hypothetical protein